MKFVFLPYDHDSEGFADSTKAGGDFSYRNTTNDPVWKSDTNLRGFTMIVEVSSLIRGVSTNESKDDLLRLTETS